MVVPEFEDGLLEMKIEEPREPSRALLKLTATTETARQDTTPDAHVLIREILLKEHPTIALRIFLGN